MSQTFAAPVPSRHEVEARFALDELFFSRTTPAGIIKFGNTVFQRVSEYHWGELLDQPHKIIRHPDTPRAVFEKLWRTVKAGAPVGAYVKNRAKSGATYWVYAVVAPIEDGFLSVRLKPSSSLFAQVQRLYSSSVECERRDNLSPAASFAILEAEVARLGFRDYSAFMAIALQGELLARDEALRRPADLVMAHYQNLITAAGALQADADKIGEAYAQYEFMPLNFQVRAAHLGAGAAAVGAISENYGLISSELAGAARRFIASAGAVQQSIFEGLFLTCAARLQEEMAGQFRSEDAASHSTEEIARLDRQSEIFVEHAVAGLHGIGRQVDAFQQDCADMSRLATGLEVTRIMGKVESAKLSVTALDNLLDELGDFQRLLAGSLRVLEQRNIIIRSSMQDILALR